MGIKLAINVRTKYDVEKKKKRIQSMNTPAACLRGGERTNAAMYTVEDSLAS